MSSESIKLKSIDMSEYKTEQNNIDHDLLSEELKIESVADLKRLFS